MNTNNNIKNLINEYEEAKRNEITADLKLDEILRIMVDNFNKLDFKTKKAILDIIKNNDE